MLNIILISTYKMIYNGAYRRNMSMKVDIRNPHIIYKH
jgi:hypothetical protein